jgi:hypothetical protein
MPLECDQNVNFSHSITKDNLFHQEPTSISSGATTKRSSAGVSRLWDTNKASLCAPASFDHFKTSTPRMALSISLKDLPFNCIAYSE